MEILSRSYAASKISLFAKLVACAFEEIGAKSFALVVQFTS